jgi:hypothetical protein
MDMPEVTFSYQVLMNAVFAATDARGSVYPNDHNCIALSQATVKSIVEEFDPELRAADAKDNHALARRLWYRFKEYRPLCACGIVRLMSPVPHDLVGIVTAEDILGTDAKISKGASCLDREMLSDDLSELSGVSVSFPSTPQQFGSKRPANPIKLPERPQANTSSSHAVEMTLIEPQTKIIFKRSQGGVFGIGEWPVSAIRAFAVWF